MAASQLRESSARRTVEKRIMLLDGRLFSEKSVPRPLFNLGERARGADNGAAACAADLPRDYFSNVYHGPNLLLLLLSKRKSSFANGPGHEA